MGYFLNINSYTGFFHRGSTLIKNNPNVSNERSAIEYYELMNNYTDDLRILQKALRRLIKYGGYIYHLTCILSIVIKGVCGQDPGGS